MRTRNPPLDIIGQSVLSDAFVFCPMGAGEASTIGQSTRALYRPVDCPMVRCPRLAPWMMNTIGQIRNGLSDGPRGSPSWLEFNR